MQVKDLRIGNWIKRTKGFRQITPMDFIILYGEEEEYADAYQPIPLTIELLEKCGFEKDEVCVGANGSSIPAFIKHITIAKMDDGFRLWIEIEEDKFFSFSWTKIGYLHELQNLYYALTKEELEVKI
jgi:hypothetical protein